MLELKNLYSLYILRMKIMFKSALLVIPTIAILVFLGVMYSLMPSQITGNFLITSLFLFVVCTVMSMSIASKENDTQEELLQLHSNSYINFYISRELVYLTVCIDYTLILVLVPVISSRGVERYFTRPLKPEDPVRAAILIFASGLCGFSVGDFFHKRIFKNRKTALILLIFTVTLAVTKHSIIHEVPQMSFLNYILPPVMDGFKMVGNTDYFDQSGTIAILIHTLIFVLVTMIIKIRLHRFLKY